MRQPQILVSQLPDKIHPAHAICKHMENLKVDSALVISHSEQIASVFIGSDKSARIGVLLSHPWCLLAVLLKIVPEHACTQSHIKQIKLRKYNIQSLL